ncbi:hypothetical protein RH831_11175 [Halodesulfurarchaeum sp. HSR-GB]|uniref:hypothetical protein n=1 Tax=Halodesulfurarchaeum sp. HSR-GB TaxID=3074077 RepID=UPI0028640A07|nr:hypothetical protein [Halodesulfurarchaeum sp. HSR-GB]MDR5657736.1 hypothetical protein [Halodesulfurarchaeum sp. HSR-GB]
MNKKNPQFGHDPTDSRNIDSGALNSFEEAKQSVENGEGEGLGFVVNRHDPFLVVEVHKALDGDDIVDPVENILNALGFTYMEKTEGDAVRCFYKGKLPDQLHGGDPIIVTIGGETENYAFRFYDSGWTPVSDQKITGTPEDLQEVDEDALARFLIKTGHLEG